MELLRLPVDQHQDMIDEWRETLNRPEQPRLLVQGVTGLGKTREVIEFLRTLDRELPAGKRLTILMPRSDMDVPQGFPEDLPRENLVLLLNDLHRWYEEGPRVNTMRFGVESEPFHSRLQNVITYFEEKSKGYGPFRIIATARSEPEFWERIFPNSPFWNTFTIVELKRLHFDQVSDLIDAAATKFGDISVDHSAKGIIADKNDGTFGSIILYLAKEKTEGGTVINEEMVRTEFTGVYRKEWEEKVYTPFIKPFPARVHVISALNLLDQAGVPFIKEVVVEIAARIWHIRQPLWWRRRSIRKELVALQFLVQESEEVLSCPEAYFENRGDLVAEISTITSTLLAMTRNRRLRGPLFNSLLNFGILLTDRYYEEQAERVFARLVKLYPTSVETRYEYGYILFWKGYFKQAKREIAQAIILDPSDPRYHVVHGDILSLQAMFTEAEPHYKTAIRLTSHWDAKTPWILYEYAHYLLTVGMRNEAISYLEQLLDISPDYVSARCVLALTLMDKADQDKAGEQADLAIRSSPWSTTGYHNVARVHRRLGNPQEAIEHFSKAIEMGRGGAAYVYDTYLERALCYVQLREQQLAYQDLARARKAASTLIRRCPNNFTAIYTLAFTYLVQGDTRRAIQTIRRAQTICALPPVISDWAEETRRLGAIAPTLTGLTEFLDALDHPKRTRQQIIPDFRKPMAFLKPDESLGRRLERVADLRRMRDQAIRIQQALQAETIEVLEQGVRVVLTGDQQVQVLELDRVPNERVVKAVNTGIKKSQQIAAAKLMEISEDPTAFFLGGQSIDLTQTHPGEEQIVIEQSPAIHISLPYVEGSIEKVSYEIQDEYFNLIIIPGDGLLFSDKDVVFTKGDHLPVLEEEQIKEMERTKDNTITKFVISIPYKQGSTKKVSYNIASNYFHLILHGSITSSFDGSKVKFARSAEKASLGERQESGSRVKYTCPDCGANAWGKDGLRLICADCNLPFTGDTPAEVGETS